jgi:hypothetical protein
MPTVIGHHDVTDTQHWLASPKREELFGPLGVTNTRTFVDPQNPRTFVDPQNPTRVAPRPKAA